MSAEIEQRLQALRESAPQVDQQLADLDEKLAQWLAAMQAGQDAMIAGVRELPVAEVAAPPPPQPAPEPDPEPEPVAMFAVNETPEASAPETADTTAAPQADADGTEEDDEALLAELDEETATQVRVRRRLTGRRRSIRELIEEVQAEKANEPETKKSSWWSRGS